jgi:hypothetical protein
MTNFSLKEHVLFNQNITIVFHSLTHALTKIVNFEIPHFHMPENKENFKQY